MKMGSNRNRTAGHNAERDVVLWLKKLGFDVVTARSESRNMDNLKVDVFSPEGSEHPLPYFIQVKLSQNNPNYHEILSEMPRRTNRTPIIIHKKVRKANSRFVGVGEYVIMTKEDFEKILSNETH